MDLSARMEVCITNSKKIPVEEQAIPTQEPPRSVSKSKDTKEVELVIGDRSRTARIRAHLDPKKEDALVSFLCRNIDMFAWKPNDMPSVPRELIEHSLNVSLPTKPIKQKL